ncbi:DUF1902 domain-containing protein [Desulfurobacterium sp. TC5-1]|uniref:DUF1902 domain-containing protein n=1 Tax=Desulfurobacterium sp. TC5-1 TaxID=1158318 RepID=UPI0003B7501A|nr:DUF1902 domain-containing protein [Desulfurobacterium sp. TC5-1]
MESRMINVKAVWDKDAQVWVAIGENVPGLVTEADTLEQLIEKLKVMIPELLEANRLLPNNKEEIHFRLLSECTEVVKVGA